MCGITGKLSFNDTPVDIADIGRMNDAIIHRGPDDGGSYLSPDGRVGLGHRRLSIIDLSPLGHQPMRYMDRYEIVFNGEIYNFQEKREMLEKEGYVFASHSDTEVILALYDRFGKDCLEHLRGMFAFAIYDEREKTLFCARDRVGKKPFKYYADDNVFLFASELKAILTQSEYHREPDYLAIHHYLTLRYVPAPLTGFSGIKKLEPAHFLFIDLKTGTIEKERYWKLDYSEKLDLSEGEWKKRIMEKLEESVKIRMVSDVPIGAFLSGGIDSSAIVGLMSRHSDRPVKTFSIGFKEEQYNELPYAKTVSDLFKTEHTEFVVEPKAMEVMPLLVRHFEEPFADKSMIPTYYVSKLTRERVTVALSGDGGDENFAGYAQHGIFRFSLLYDKVLFLHRLIVLPVTAFLAARVKNTFFLRAHQFAKTMAEPYAHRYANYMCYFTDEEKEMVYTDDFRKRFSDVDSLELVASEFFGSGSADRLDQALFADFMTYLPDDLMVKADITTMAVALESRSPFLDHEFLELTAKIPSRLKIRGMNNRKYILKKSLEGFLPDSILYRKKMGFASPIDIWFKTDLRDYARELLLSPKAVSRVIFRKEAVEKMLDDHVTTNINYARHILALVVLESWFLEFFDEKTA
ncbi:MAG: asparagine synthase (glutamine-hydrolyzing) [Candidatus Moraniibacteriota bacterium]